jgi:GDPmannose 4,6-dehydratase
VREFISLCAPHFGLKIGWVDKGLKEIGVESSDPTNLKTIIEVSEKYFRPAEVESLLGDSSLARKDLGWEPKYNIDALVKDMCEHA